MRTNSILSAYNDFLVAFFKINTAANVGEKEVTFKENIRQPLDAYLISINKIDIWINKKSSEELREILGIFRKISHEIFSAKGKQLSLKVDSWSKFSNSLEKMKTIVAQEVRSNDLRNFVFSVKI